MDRYSELGSTEKRLIYQGALEFIGEVKGGISWERFCMQGIRYFDAFIDFLSDTGEVTEFLFLKHIDKDYVVENVKKILERMHFNPSNDYYLTLGLPHSATELQIHNRWKNLMFLYHPDRNRDSGEYASTYARKINEVYSILKDVGKKLEYDRKMTRRMAESVGVRRDLREMRALPNIAKIEQHYFLSPSMRKILAKVILPLSIVISFLILVIIFFGK